MRADPCASHASAVTRASAPAASGTSVCTATKIAPRSLQLWRCTELSYFCGSLDRPESGSLRSLEVEPLLATAPFAAHKRTFDLLEYQSLHSKPSNSFHGESTIKTQSPT
jgi:hypothetical protein